MSLSLTIWSHSTLSRSKCFRHSWRGQSSWEVHIILEGLRANVLFCFKKQILNLTQMLYVIIIFAPVQMSLVTFYLPFAISFHLIKVKSEVLCHHFTSQLSDYVIRTLQDHPRPSKVRPWNFLHFFGLWLKFQWDYQGIISGLAHLWTVDG